MIFTGNDRALLYFIVKQNTELSEQVARLTRAVHRIGRDVSEDLDMARTTQQVIDDLKVELAANTDATAAVTQAVDTLLGQIQDNIDDPEELQLVLDGFRANTASIIEAAHRGTPAEAPPTDGATGPA